MEFTVNSILFLIIGLVIGFLLMIGLSIVTGLASRKKAEKILEEAKLGADNYKKNSLSELKEEMHKMKMEVEKDIKEKKSEFKNAESRLLDREKSLDKREELLQKRDLSLEEKNNSLILMQTKIQEKEAKMDELLKSEMEKLESIAHFTKDKAKNLIIERTEKEMQKEVSEIIKEREAEAKLEADKKARNILIEAMQRYANDVTTEQTVSTINLPNDELKGRLIGREGRNIRTIEAVTGVDLIIDDTPEVIVVSSFDPYRREIAKITIETLLKDGRIHPTRIEEVYDKVSNDMNAKTLEIGNNALSTLGITKMDPELVLLVGKLNYRTSYGQNALSHSIEVANLCSLIASEMGINSQIAKRAGLLHDIGKAIDFEIEGSHVEIGANITKKYGEPEIIIDAILSHHGDNEVKSSIGWLVQIADTLSAARPGARNDSLENYIQRLEQLEKIGNSIKGVDKTYAMQAGRELRVMVNPGEVDDLSSYKIARDLKTKIEEEMQYPGTIKITVIRETRVQEEAK